MKIFKKNIVYLYAFYLFYLPDFSFLGPIFSNALIITLLALFNVLFLNKKLVVYIDKTKMLPVIVIYILTLLYLLILNLIYEFDFMNIWPNIQFILLVINFISLLIWYKKVFKTNKNIDDFIIKIGVIQAILAILMLIFPPFKEVANFLASQGGELPLHLISLLNYRMYGIASSYTFMLPLIQSFIAILAFNKYIKDYQFRNLIISVFVLISSILNNRTGLYIYFVAVFLIVGYKLVTKLNLRIIIVVITTIFGIVSLIFILYKFVPTRFEWLIQVYDELANIIQGDQASGTLGVLSDHWVMPSDVNFLFGYGQRVFGQLGLNTFGFNSDIGFVNDLFKGGLLFTLTTYLTHYFYWLKNMNNNFLVNVLFISLMIANYKGEVMVASSLIFILYLISFDRIIKKEI